MSIEFFDLIEIREEGELKKLLAFDLQLNLSCYLEKVHASTSSSNVEGSALEINGLKRREKFDSKKEMDDYVDSVLRMSNHCDTWNNSLAARALGIVPKSV